MNLFLFADRWERGKRFIAFWSMWPESKYKFYTVCGVSWKSKDYKSMFQH